MVVKITNLGTIFKKTKQIELWEIMVRTCHGMLVGDIGKEFHAFDLRMNTKY